MMIRNRFAGRLSLVLLTLVMAACVSVPDAQRDPRDPFEGYNRAMFKFNKALDDNALKPVATGYSEYIPSFIRTGVGNFFGNLGDVWTAVNNYLQGKPREGTSDVARVVVNTTFGVVGLIDVATPAGLAKHEEDFGQTLAVWGVSSGPYVVLPFFGSSTLRDSVAKPVDLYADPVNQFDNVRAENTARGIRIVDDRAALLDSGRLMEGAALDPYQFVRDAYLQRRADRVADGASN